MSKVTYPYRWKDSVVISTMELISGVSTYENFLLDLHKRTGNEWDLQAGLALKLMKARPGLRLENVDDKVIMVEDTHCSLPGSICTPIRHPKLAVTGRLSGWKLYAIEIRHKGKVRVRFCDTSYTQTADFELRWSKFYDYAPNFSVVAPGENGKTRYTYEYLPDAESAIVKEKSKYHRRAILMLGHGEIMVEEELPEGFVL